MRGVQTGKTFRAPHRLNRILLLVLGLAFVAAGGAGLAAALGAFGTGLEHRTLYDNPAGRYVGAHGNWIWPVAAAVSVVLALFALRWLIAQITIQRATSVALDTPSQGGGHTTLRAVALTDAVANEVRGYRGVTHVTAHLLGDHGDERLAVAITFADRVPFGPLRDRIEHDAIGSARTALGDDRFPTVLVIDVTTKPPD